MTFEQKFKEMLKVNLNAIFGDKTPYDKIVTVSNDMSSKALEKENSFLAVIKTGQGLRTAIPGYDVVHLSTYIEFYFDRNFVQDFLGEMQDYIKTINAETRSLVIDDVLTYYRLNFNNPTVSQSALDQAVEGRTMQFSQVTWIGEIIYSTKVDFKPDTITFEYQVTDDDALYYQANNILRTNFIMQPVFETVQVMGEKTSRKEIIGYERTCEIVVLVVKGDAFTDVFERDIKNIETIDQTRPMHLNINGDFVKIQTITPNISYENGQKTLTVVFS
jgi:hypothetical protein